MSRRPAGPPPPAIPGPPPRSRLAVYAGSFDPPTRGHLDVVRRATRLFDRVLVAVGSHPTKKPLFTPDERVTMIRDCLGDLPGVEVVAFQGLMVDLCRERGAVALIRGLRANSDFDSEFQMGLANQDLMPGLDTVFLLPDLRYQFISSSLAREVAQFGGDASRYLEGGVAAALVARLKEVQARSK